MSQKTKKIGTLLPMTALVSKSTKDGSFVAGEKFIDWLHKSKQNAWQLLPIHQTQLEKNSKTKHIPSPYKGYGIGLDPRFLSDNPPQPSADQLKKFINNNNYWLENYSLFCALRDELGTDDWTQWPADIRERDQTTLLKWQEKLTKEINKHLYIQTQLAMEYKVLQKKAKAKEIELIGDLPLYLSLSSPLVWQYQDLFEINDQGQLEQASGVIKGPKSYFGRQLWGHPLYKWQNKQLLPKLEKLFQIRLNYLANLFDWIRLDHAQGLFIYTSLDLTGKKKDKLLKGPGSKFLKKIINFARSKNIEIYAEDTGNNLKKLRDCLASHQIPGITIFKYGYNEKKKKFLNRYLHIDKYSSNTFAYTTTHDSETLISYLTNLSNEEINNLGKKINIENITNIKNFAEKIKNKVINSPAKIVLIPLQDWLYTTGRINTPGTEKEINDDNWQYTMSIPIEELPINIYKIDD